MGQKSSSVFKKSSFRSNVDDVAPVQSYNINSNYKDDEPISQKQNIKKNDDTTTNPVDLEGAIKLSLRLKKKILKSSSFTDQTLPMLVSLTAESLKSNTKAPLDLVCVIDHSGSMAGEKMELVKNTFNYLFEYLSDDDRLSIIIFDDHVERLTPLMRTTSFNKEHILSKIKPIYARGGTDINLGMTHAFEVLKQRRQANSITSIFLLSDGLDGGAQDKVKASLNHAGLKNDIIINTFGFGNDHDPQLMIDIANLRDGNFYFIEKLDTVDEAFVDCLGGALSSLAKNIQISIKAEQSEILKGDEIVKAYGDTNMWALDQKTKTYTTKLGSLVSGRQKDFVLEIKVPANKKTLSDEQKNIKIASAQADMTALDGRQLVKHAELTISLLNEGEILAMEEDDKEVMKNFYRVKSALLIKDARDMADQGKNDEAKKLLQGFKEEIENSFLKNEQFIKNMIKDIDSVIEAVNPVVYQVHGKQLMMENERAQMYQKSNLKCFNSYQNSMQCDMLMDVKKKKGY